MLRKAFVALVLLLVVAVSLFWISWPDQIASRSSSFDVAALLNALSEVEQQGFAHVDYSKALEFPRDHGAHPKFFAETWFFSGHLATQEGRQFGFQLMFVRIALTPEPPQSSSAWATNQIYRAHFALTDVAADQFYTSERFSRAALGLSGAEEDPVRVWLENWSMTVLSEHADLPHFRLQADDDDFAMDLNLQSIKATVAPDGEDFVQAGSSGDGLRVYWAPRMSAQGQLKIGNEQYDVAGLAWLERAWGAVPIGGEGQIEFDRFVLQLDDDREMMIFQLHRRDGSAAPAVTGLLISAVGEIYRLGRRDLNLQVTHEWRSPIDGARYPAGWRLQLPYAKINLVLRPTVANQEMNFILRYWGGTVAFSGDVGGQPVTGSGYAELRGYGRAGPL